MQGLHPFHFQRVQDLMPQDFPARVQFCRWILGHRNKLSKILWSDEANFSRCKVFNSHNTHLWADENPRGVRRTNFQNRFSINLWAGIIGNQLIGPIELPNNLNSQRYLDFLQNRLPELLEDIPLETRVGMYFQHDGAPAHFGQAVRIWLNEKYPEKWIGRGGPIAWPARSPDLNPLDYYLWGHMSNLVYAAEVDTREELLQRIILAGNQIKENNFQILRASQNILRRARYCIEQNGNLFEHLLN